jgi:ribonuclease BN (tRNA processing enzyme)
VTTLTFVGTGSAFSRKYGHSNALVEKGDVRLMLDFGYQSSVRLGTMGLGLERITHVAISHLHADHTGGLEELAFMTYFVHRTRPRLLVPGEVAKPLWDHCLSGGLGWIADDQGAPLRREMNDYFEVLLLDESKWCRIGDLEIRPFEVDHVPGTFSYGFLVRDTDDGSQFIVTGDVRTLVPELLEKELSPDFAKGPIFHDCQLFDGGPSSIHVSLQRILEYPKEVRERILLTHYGDRVEEHLEEIQEAGLSLVWPSQPIELARWQKSLGTTVVRDD